MAEHLSTAAKGRSLRSTTFRSTLARQLVEVASASSKRLGLGSGSTIGGRVGLMLDPQLLARIATSQRVVLVSGTNGKTTTTRLAATAVSTLGEVATSAAGANMAAGLVSALIANSSSTFAVLEIDEAHLPAVADQTCPEVIVLLNLSRDQLDRTNEVRMLAERWRVSISTIDACVVANADDPLVVWAAEKAANVVWVSVGGNWHEDAYHCPECDARIEFSAASASRYWSCSCGFARPTPAFTLTEAGLVTPTGEVEQIALQLPGRFNQGNAAMAAVAARQLGVPIAVALSSMGAVTDVAGRFARHGVGGRAGSLMLAKNPAGWTELIDLVAATTSPLVIGINARIADGHDPSWLWDVPFERLNRHAVVATGDRRHDLAVRLLHAGVEHIVSPEPVLALRDFGEGEIDFIGNYTAFQDVRRALSAKPSLLSTDIGSIEPARVVASRDSTAADPSNFDTAHTASPRESRLRIVIVHPDLLGTYGDAGNGMVLANRALWHDLSVELVLAPSDAPLPSAGDIYCLGGGEDGPQVRAAETLRNGALHAAIERGATVLAVCAGYQILGQSFPGVHGKTTDGLGLLDVTTSRGEQRAVGEVLIEDGKGHLLTGFENHAGRTTRGAGVLPFGTIRSGIGNGDGTDGARTGQIVGTYLHGPALARNSRFADELLSIATGTTLLPIDDHEEELLSAERLRAVRTSGTSIQGFRRRLRHRRDPGLVSS